MTSPRKSIPGRGDSQTQVPRCKAASMIGNRRRIGDWCAGNVRQKKKVSEKDGRKVGARSVLYRPR